MGRLSPDGALHHLLFSPAGPSLLMFCHEGPWHKVDRIWAMWTDGTAVTKIHTRAMAMEIFGHEFWSPDGKTLWYDLQTPRGRDFWLASYRLDSGERTNGRSTSPIHFADPLQCVARRQAVLRRRR